MSLLYDALITALCCNNYMIAMGRKKAIRATWHGLTVPSANWQQGMNDIISLTCTSSMLHMLSRLVYFFSLALLHGHAVLCFICMCCLVKKIPN